MVAFKNRLSEFRINFEKVEVPEKIFEQIQDILKDYNHATQKQIIDDAYIKINNM